MLMFRANPSARLCALTASLLALVAGADVPVNAAQQTATFTGAAGSVPLLWSNPANWNIGSVYANNNSPLGTTYRAVMNLAGPRQISLDVPVTLDQFDLGGSLLTLTGDAPMTLLGNLNISASQFRSNQSLSVGGAVNLSGTGNLLIASQGNTLPVINALGSSRLRLAGGTISNSTLNFGPSARLRVDSTVGGLVNVTFASSYRFVTAGGGALLPVNGVSVNGTLTFDGTSLGSSASQSLGSGTYAFENGGGGMQDLEGGPATTVTVPSEASLVVRNGALTVLRTNGLINQSTITTTGSNATLRISSQTFLNQGVVEATDGSLLFIDGAWSNQGIIRADNSRVDLGGTVAATELGSLQRIGSGVFSLTGTIQNTGTVFNVDATLGSFEANGVTIRGGTVNITGGQSLSLTGGTGKLSDRSVQFDGVTLNSDLILPQQSTDQHIAARVSIKDRLTLNATLRLTGVNSEISILNRNVDPVNNPDTVSLSGGVIEFDRPSIAQGAKMTLQPSTTLIISQSTMIRGGGAEVLGDISTSIQNNGVIAANLTGKTLRLAPGSLTNTGTLEASNGGTLEIYSQKPWTNSGTLRVDQGTLELQGTFQLDPGTTWQRNGGTVRFGGTLNNVGRTLELNASTGSWNAVGGTVLGGVVRFTDGHGFVLPIANSASPQPSLTLDAVTVDGDLTDSTRSGGIRARNGLTMLGGSVILDGNASKISFFGSQTFSGGTVRLVAPGTYDTSVEIGVLSTLTIAGDAAIRGGSMGRGNSFIGSNFGPSTPTTLVNFGTIAAEGADRWLQVRPNFLDNRGLIEATGGATLEILNDNYNSWKSSGTLRAGPGSRLILGGSVNGAEMGAIESNGGEVWISGRIENSGNTLELNATTGSWNLWREGAIKGGTVRTLDGTSLVAGPNGPAYLDGVRIQGRVDIDSVPLFIRNGLVLDGTVNLRGESGSIRFEDSAVLNSGQFVFDNTSGGGQRVIAVGSVASAPSLTLGPAVTVRGGNGRMLTSGPLPGVSLGGTIINQGTIIADVAGQSITIDTIRFVNEGTLTAANGGSIVLVPPDQSGRGTVDGSVGNQGTLAIDAMSQLSIFGLFSQSSEGTLTIGLDGTDYWLRGGRIAVSGEASLHGRLVVAASPGFRPAAGATVDILDLVSATGWFSQVELPVLESGLSWDTSQLSGTGVLRVVPSPGGVAMAMVFLIAHGRRRRAAFNRGGVA